MTNWCQHVQIVFFFFLSPLSLLLQCSSISLSFCRSALILLYTSGLSMYFSVCFFIRIANGIMRKAISLPFLFYFMRFPLIMVHWWLFMNSTDVNDENLSLTLDELYYMWHCGRVWVCVCEYRYKGQSQITSFCSHWRACSLWISAATQKDDSTAGNRRGKKTFSIQQQ